MDAHSELRGRWRLAALAAIVLSACGGGGDSSAPTPTASAPPPSGHDYVSTMHLKNADVDAAAVAPQPLYNNAGYAVIESGGASTAASLSHTLHIGKLARGGISASCDRVDVVAWRHTLDTTTGSLELQATTLWSFGAHESAGVVSLCSG